MSQASNPGGERRPPRASRREAAPDSAQSDLFARALAGSPAPRPDPAGEIVRRRPGPIRVGTSGYSFLDWVGPFYPSGTPRRAMLDHYRRVFSAVEVNSTYSRLPPPSTMQRMAERTPPDFQFTAKLPGELTHGRDRQIGPADGFRRTVAPLEEAGKFVGALAQFPFSFRRTQDAEENLDWLHQALPETPLFVEFRHGSWDTPELEEMLRGKGLGFCSVDEPRLPGLIPQKALLTGETAYVRLHGRNGRDWWGGGSERYNYLYRKEELEEWAQVIRELSTQAHRTYIFFNNCHAGHAVANARMMEELLGLEPDRG